MTREQILRLQISAYARQHKLEISGVRFWQTQRLQNASRQDARKWRAAAQEKIAELRRLRNDRHTSE
jgi:hypothetical protein